MTGKYEIYFETSDFHSLVSEEFGRLGYDVVLLG
jgi:hypothetical protein